jgi:hypothetical protein
LKINLRSLRKEERYSFISNYRIAKLSNTVGIKFGCSYSQFKEKFTLLPYQVLFFMTKVGNEDRIEDEKKFLKMKEDFT